MDYVRLTEGRLGGLGALNEELHGCGLDEQNLCLWDGSASVFSCRWSMILESVRSSFESPESDPPQPFACSSPTHSFPQTLLNIKKKISPFLAHQ